MKLHSINLTLLVTAAALLGWTGCTANAHLKPALSAHAIAPNIAVTQQAGLHVRAEADDWHFRPSNLADRYTPMKITIHNAGDMPVVVRYGEFMLRRPNGKEFHAIPPINASGSVTQSTRYPVSYAYPYSGFYLAPYDAGWYPGWSLWDGGDFDWDDAYFGSYWPMWQAYPAWRVKLPTRAMIDRALPEGVLKPGGTLTGFHYFEKIPNDVKKVELEANLRAPGHGPQVAKLEIPFVVK